MGATKPKKAKAKKPGTRGPKSDAAIAKMAALSKDWRDDAEETMVALQRELRSRLTQLDTMDLIGAIRVIGETLTTSRALIPEPVEPEPAAPAPQPTLPVEDPSAP